MIKILIADDHPIVREGLRQIIEVATDMVVTDEARNGEEVLEKIKENDFDVVILDISMPGRSGLDILKEVRKERPELSVLILSIHPEEQYGVRLLKAGASGYLTKESAPEELVNAIRIISQGRKYITSSLAERLALKLGDDFEGPLHENLSDREYEVMYMIAKGMTIKEIAEKLFLSVKTISTYRYRILGKMRMKSNAELIRYALKLGLVD